MRGALPGALASLRFPPAFSSDGCRRASDPSPAPPVPQDVVAWFAGLPWKRFAIWGVVAFVGYQLQDFFSLAMGTFIIAFVGGSFVQAGLSWQALSNVPEQASGGASSAPEGARDPDRRVLTSLALPPCQNRRRGLVVTYFALIASVFTLFGVMTIPDLVSLGFESIGPEDRSIGSPSRAPMTCR